MKIKLLVCCTAEISALLFLNRERESLFVEIVTVFLFSACPCIVKTLQCKLGAYADQSDEHLEERHC